MIDNSKAAKNDLIQVMTKYGNLVYGTARTHLPDKSAADDIYQEVFLLYYTKDLHFEDESARRSWLIRTAVNLCRTARRDPWLTRRDNDTQIEYAADENISSDPKIQEVWNAVRGLDEKYRTVVYLYYFENMPVHEIARTLKMKEGAVQMRLTRARRTLKKRLEGELFG